MSVGPAGPGECGEAGDQIRRSAGPFIAAVCGAPIFGGRRKP
ncbi:hypothetical protein L840_1556 [Mycobacterium sp. MAC_011194_8550]|nr:hypothetical protein L839_2558 [Mycobacterium avium MAV_120809_2495]ETZ68831.1 hypothetical protein L840_1556 [Mycobacterium sp. MAC_011194_8550]